jgi:1,4-alpha-glucan branching enzyme
MKESIHQRAVRTLVAAEATTPVTQEHVDANTRMGANVIPEGTTFRAWAPNAIEVHVMVNGDKNMWKPSPATLLTKSSPDGYWTGFVAGAKDGDGYRFYVKGLGSEGFKRDPYARELRPPDFPDCDCIIRDPAKYVWHDQNYRMPPFNDLVVYELHVGTFYSVDENGADNRMTRVGTFLDVLKKIEYLADLGVNALQLMPIDEFRTARSRGYNGVDMYSPELDYAVPASDIAAYLPMINGLLQKKNCAPLGNVELTSAINQLKALVDIAHLYNLAVFFDVVYNHAGGDFGDQSMYFFDRQKDEGHASSLYFANSEWAGGLVFDYQKAPVRQFLIDNGRFFIDEYHINGIRYDEVTVIDRNGGWFFCQDLTGTLKFADPDAIEIAEYWGDQRWRAVCGPPEGMGFHAAWHDGMREAVREAILQARAGREAYVNLDPIRDALYRPFNFPGLWTAVQQLESHDVIDAGHTDRKPRIAALADAINPASWYARSRSRVADGLLMAGGGLPMLFTGQEFLESRFWSDTPTPDTLTSWDALAFDKDRMDHLRFMKDMIWLRRQQAALRSENINVFHVNNDNRVIAFHRWLENGGGDVVVIATLNESTLWNYSIGFPLTGSWREGLNSDYYDTCPNPQLAGNGGRITADGCGMHGLPASATIVIPANSILVFVRD